MSCLEVSGLLGCLAMLEPFGTTLLSSALCGSGAGVITFDSQTDLKQHQMN